MTPRTLPAWCALALLAFQEVQTPLPALPPADVIAHHVAVIRDWVTAVERHTPGEHDEAMQIVSRWSGADVQSAWLDVQVLLELLRNRDANAFFVKIEGKRSEQRIATTRQDLAAFRGLADQIPQRFGPPGSFVKRAAVLHTDLAMAIHSDENAEVWSPQFTPGRVVVRAQDGQQVSMHGGMVHWEFGRLLLDAVPEPARDSFVRSWYRATLAFKLRFKELDTPHFNHARALLPDDPVIQFQLGCLHEALADPHIQVVARAARLPADMKLLVRSERDELRDAEAEFRRALDLDPADAEARLRHGRTLGRLDRHKDAAAELRQALAATADPLLTYYGQLFLAAEEEALGRLPEARAAYERAAQMEPHAQAPKMGLSQLAHRAGDRAAARAALAAVMQARRANAEAHDPWWDYRTASGRRADDLVAAMYRELAGVPR